MAWSVFHGCWIERVPRGSLYAGISGTGSTAWKATATASGKRCGGQKKSTTPKDDAFPKPMVFVPQLFLKIKIHW
jgi:hypothetical protein